MSKFDQLHPNQFWAFIDGLLTGAVFVYGAMLIRKAIKR